MKSRAFVLLSGGLDSTTLLYAAKNEFKDVEAISINYSQRHAKEIQFAAKNADRLRVPHTVLELRDVLVGVMLTDATKEIPNVTYDDIKGMSPTYVPFRNGTMLSMIVAYAQRWVMANAPINAAPNDGSIIAGVYFGAHAEDAANWAYPDCTPEFIGAMANAIFIGTYQTVRLHTPLMWLKKDEIVTLGAKLGVPFEDTWSCYAGGQDHCGKCPTCYARAAAFDKAGIGDPTKYETDPRKGLNLKATVQD